MIFKYNSNYLLKLFINIHKYQRNNKYSYLQYSNLFVLFLIF